MKPTLADVHRWSVTFQGTCDGIIVLAPTAADAVTIASHHWLTLGRGPVPNVRHIAAILPPACEHCRTYIDAERRAVNEVYP